MIFVSSDCKYRLMVKSTSIKNFQSKKYNMNKNKFNGLFLGNIGEVYGSESKIEIEYLDCWLNINSNITLHINNGESLILCSSKLSDIIRKRRLDEDTNELKKFSVYEFEDGIKYATSLIESKSLISIDENKFSLIDEISRMYLIEVFSGYYNQKNRFIAVDKQANEYFTDDLCTSKHQLIFNILKKRLKSMWILVENQIWTSWNNRRVSKIVTVSETPFECQSYKEMLLKRAQIKIEKIIIFEEQLNLINNQQNITNFFEQEKKLKEKENKLNQKLKRLNILIND